MTPPPVIMNGRSPPSPSGPEQTRHAFLREALLQLLEDAWVREQRLIEALPTRERTRRGASDNWSCRDVVAHIAAWRRQAATQLTHVGRGGTGFAVEIQAFNNKTFLEHQGESWTTIKRVARLSYLALRAQTEQLSDDHLRRPAGLSGLNWSPWELIKVDGYDHPMRHIASLYRSFGNCAEADSIEAAISRGSRELAMARA